MKYVPEVATALRSKYVVHAQPKATVEWNMNRYFNLEVWNGDLDEEVYGNDRDLFPLESIAEPWRPTKGINKARADYAYAGSNHTDWPTARFYLASEEDKYKYWMSPFPSDFWGGLTGCTPSITYTETFQANRIKAVVENTWASPTEYSIQYTTNGGASWNDTVAAPVQPDGTIEVFWTGTGWSATRPEHMDASIPMNGVRFNCTRLGVGRLVDGSPTVTRSRGVLVNPTGQSSYLSLIELAPCLIRDLSDIIIEADSTFDAGERSVVAPVGRLTTNEGSVTLWNEQNIFSTENTSSPYHRLIEPNAEIRLSYVYDIDGAKYEVPDFTMYVNDWSFSSDGTVTISASDSSKHLSMVKPRACKYENLTFAEIMYRICDSVGWNRYRVDTTKRALDLKVPVFWTDGESTVWEILNDLAEVSQTVLYFDEEGYLNIKTREDAYSPDAVPVWTLRSESTGNELADIIDLEQSGEYGSNTVKIVYKDTKWAENKNGFVENSAVWEADDPTVLRSTPLLHTLQVGVTDADGRERFRIPGGNDAATWPHQGMVLIEGEVIEYDAKMFVYQDGGRFNWAWVESQAQHDELNERVKYAARHRNYYDGQFRIKERGLWNSNVTTHEVNAAKYTATLYPKSGGTKTGVGFHFNRRESQVNIRTAGLANTGDDILTATRGVPGDAPWRYVGTRLIFNNTNVQHQAGGLVWNMQFGGKDGYYVELCPTSQISDKDREVRNEMVFYVIKNGKRSPNFPVKGAKAPVAMGMWGDLDVWTNYGSHVVRIFYRGQQYHHVQVPEAWRLTPSGKFGMFARGVSDVSFEYLYASSGQHEPEPQGMYSAVHVIDGMETGRNWSREWVHRNTRGQRNKRRRTKKPIWDKRQRFMDEFGPYVHEMREFDVKFDPAPVQSSFPFSTNDYAAYLIDYNADSSSARFTMVSTERYNAVLSGEDAMFSPGGDAVNNQLIVFGRALVIEEGEEVVVKNEQQVRARGEIVTEINSDWLQSEEAAQTIGDWIVNHWSKGVDEITVNIFGNPLFRIGDVVAVEFPSQHMRAGTHHYFVTGTNTSFSHGISTTLTLRRRN